MKSCRHAGPCARPGSQLSAGVALVLLAGPDLLGGAGYADNTGSRQFGLLSCYHIYEVGYKCTLRIKVCAWPS